MVKIYAIGGFSEVGKNMAVLETGEDAFIFDEGFFLPAIVSMQERDGFLTERKLRAVGAIPDDSIIENIRHKVRAQFVGHAHLDHVGAVPFMSDRYNAPIYGTPFTIEILKSLLLDNQSYIRNPIKAIQPNTTFFIQGKSRKYQVDFINITHSTIQTSLIAIHTDKGIVLYANDFKLDNNPIVGQKPNYQKLREIAKEGVYALIVDSLYAPADRKTSSEKIARTMLEEVLLTTQNRKNGVVVTTFSSHIARLKSIVEFGQQMGRQVVFLGRSLNKYCDAANKLKLAPFFSGVRMFKYRNQVEKILSKIDRERSKYLVVCTGHQGEPGSILERISRNQLPFKFMRDDNVVFSSSVIPAEVNKEQFEKMEQKLRKSKTRIFRDVHVSGHAGREDLRDMISILQPQHIIPAHGGPDKTEAMIELAEEMGYKPGKDCHLMMDGETLSL